MSGILAGSFTPASTHIYVLPGEFDYCGISIISPAGIDGEGNWLQEQVSTKKTIPAR